MKLKIIEVDNHCTTLNRREVTVECEYFHNQGGGLFLQIWNKETQTVDLVKGYSPSGYFSFEVIER